jgi:hypothetical protein
MKFDAWKDDAFPDIQAEFEAYYHTEEQMAALFPTFTNVFRRFGNWLKSQDRVEVYVIGECLYWEF